MIVGQYAATKTFLCDFRPMTGEMRDEWNDRESHIDCPFLAVAWSRQATTAAYKRGYRVAPRVDTVRSVTCEPVSLSDLVYDDLHVRLAHDPSLVSAILATPNRLQLRGFSVCLSNAPTRWYQCTLTSSKYNHPVDTCGLYVTNDSGRLCSSRLEYYFAVDKLTNTLVTSHRRFHVDGFGLYTRKSMWEEDVMFHHSLSFHMYSKLESCNYVAQVGVQNSKIVACTALFELFQMPRTLVQILWDLLKESILGSFTIVVDYDF